MAEKRKIVVVTGCLGFIGQYITSACLQRGWYVYGVDKKTYAADPDPCFDLNHERFKLLEEDISEMKTLPDCDYVINLAAESHVGNSIVGSKEFVKTNVDGVRNILELIRAKPDNCYGKPRLLHFSTDEVYGDTATGSFWEASPLNPSNPYSASKAAGDMLIKAWARTYGQKYIIVRPTNNYGIGQFPEKLIPLCVKALQADKKIVLHNQGTPVRSWLHVEDTASAVICILDSIPHGIFPESVFNIGGKEQRNIDVVRKVVDHFLLRNPSRTSDKEFAEQWCENGTRQGQDVRYAVDDSALRKLGWKPTRDFDTELRWIVEDCRERFRW